MGNQPENDDALLIILLTTLVRSEWDDDPRLREVLYRRLRRQPQFRESLDPELEELLFLRSPRRPRRLEEAREIATSVLEGFRASFEDSVGKRIEDLSTRVGVVEEAQSQLTSGATSQADGQLVTKHTLHDFIWMLSSGVNIEHARMTRYVPMRIFLGEPVPGEESRKHLVDALVGLFTPLGFERSYELPEESGSWWKKLVLRTAGVFTQDEVRKRLDTAERAVEVKLLNKPQAEANNLQAAGAASLIDALTKVPNACIQVGTLLLVKETDAADKSALVVRTLTQEELKRLEEEPPMLRRPGAILELLQAPASKGTPN